MYGCIKSFCDLGDTLAGDGGADLPTTRIKIGLPRAFTISDIQSSPVGDERSSVCQCMSEAVYFMETRLGPS